MKKQSNLKRLMSYAGGHKYLTYASWVLSVISAFLALVPFIYIWQIIREVLNTAPNFSEAQNLTRYGWSAVLFAAMSLISTAVTLPYLLIRRAVTALQQAKFIRL